MLMTADEGLIRLGQRVEEYISEQGLKYVEVAKVADFSIETLSKVRQGTRVSDVTYRRLERALGWRTGSADDIRAGRDLTLAAPSNVGEVEQPAAPAPAAEPIDPQAAAILTILESLPKRVQAEVLRRLGERIPPEGKPSA